MTDPATFMRVIGNTCPCGSGQRYDACCGRLHRGAAEAATPEELMRSRYTAYAIGDLDYVWRTWHPRTRPEAIEPEAAVGWTGLEVLDATGDEVEFVAAYDRGRARGRLHERSTFEHRRGRWVYVEGELLP